jgi:hypothetical protein
MVADRFGCSGMQSCSPRIKKGLDPGDEPLEDFAESDVENSLPSLFTVPNSSSKSKRICRHHSA